MVRAVLVMMLALVLPSWAALGGDHPGTRATLKGLLGVAVLVEDLSEGAKRAGFDRSTFQTDAELKLRMAGIKVLSEEERSLAAGLASLYVNVHPLAREPGEVAPYSIELALQQLVLLRRDASVVTTATTWSVASTGQGRVQDVRDGLKNHVDKFINAWLSVNPKE